MNVSRVRSRFDEPLLTRDGVRLSADVYLPAEPGTYPALVTRTPYDNNRPPTSGGRAPSDRFKLLAAHGFVVVACDVRGRGDSDGRFVPFAREAEDGADTIDWVRALPETDGRVGLFGTGYAGYAALVASHSAGVEAVAVWSPFADATPFRGGALRLDWLFWLHVVGGRTPQPVDVPAWHDVFRHRPLATMHEALGREDAPWPESLAGTGVPPSPANSAPTLFVTGWWDGALEGTIRSWERACVAAPDVSHRLVVGPWDTPGVRHPRADVGGVAWGPRAAVDPDEMLLEWFAGHLEDEPLPSAGAHVFVTGRNAWTTVDALDTPDGATVWLTSGGAANTRRGDGRLVDAPPVEASPDRFTHNPDDPVPWQPGGGSFSRASTLVLDTSFASERDDVLAYVTAPASSGIFLRGRAAAHLWVHSDAGEADWVVALEDVCPGRGSVHLAHGIVRVGAGATGPEAITIELTPVAHELQPDHSLRLLVASSLWPLYAVNLGGRDYLRDTVSRVSEQAVFHDCRYPSSLCLPVVPVYSC